MTVSRENLLLFMEELYTLVNQLETVPAGGAPSQALLQRHDELQQKLQLLLQKVQTLREASEAKAEALRASLERAATSLRSARQQLHDRTPALALREMRQRLAESYEGLVVAIRAHPRFNHLGRRLRSLRPRNYTRNIFHVANGLAAVAMYQWVLDRTGCLWVLGGMLSVWVGIDVTRRIWPSVQRVLYDGLLSRITRPRERYTIPAATWYTVGLVLAVIIGDQTQTQLAVLVLAFGDPIASLAGKRWGRLKLIRRKSVVGTSAFMLSAFIACAVFLGTTRALPMGSLLAMAAVASCAGAIAELFSDDRIDDNLSIPLVTVVVLALVF